MTTLLRFADVTPCPVPLILRAEAPDAARAVRAGDLTRVVRGAYAPTSAWQELAPWERYLARTHAIARIERDAVFVLEAGCALSGLPVFGEPPVVHVVMPTPTKSHCLAGVRVHTTERMPRIVQLGGIRVANLAELVVDIARSRHPAIALAVANSALRRDATLTADAFLAASAARPTACGARAMDWMLDRSSKVPESTLESLSLAVIEWLGFPRPELQEWFLGSTKGDDDRVDFWWKQWRVAGEADGDVKYSGELGDAREALRERSARDARLQRRGVARRRIGPIGILRRPSSCARS